MLSARLLSQEGGSFWRFSQDRRVREAVHPGRRISHEAGSARWFSLEEGSSRKEDQP